MSDPNAALIDLIQRAEASALKSSTNRRNKALLQEMSVAIVALAQRIAQLQETTVAEPPRVLVP